MKGIVYYLPPESHCLNKLISFIDSLSTSVGLRLVGPYDILAGKHKMKKSSASLNFNLHWRFYYDPPEFQTIIIGDNRTQFHMGYFRYGTFSPLKYSSRPPDAHRETQGRPGEGRTPLTGALAGRPSCWAAPSPWGRVNSLGPISLAFPPCIFLFGFRSALSAQERCFRAAPVTCQPYCLSGWPSAGH